MTKDKEKADLYIKMMWGQITISVSILIAVVGLLAYLLGNDVQINKDVEHLKNWTNEIYRWEILPTEERSIVNAGEIVIIYKRLDKIDSLNFFQEKHINQLYNWERSRRGMLPMEGID